jgi:hypothetical protein
MSPGASLRRWSDLVTDPPPPGPTQRRSSSPGTSAELPLSLIQPGGTRARVQLFGVQGGVASPLPFKCSQTPQDFGCGPSG